MLIDPRDGRNDFNRLPIINPINLKASPSVVAQSLMDTMRILWGDKGAEGTAKIDRYMPSVLATLHKAGLTLHDAIYFTEQSHEAYKPIRNQILAKLHRLDRDRVTLEGVFNNSRSQFNLEFASTIRRLNPIFDDTMQLIVGSKENSIDFGKMISEGWLILVVLDPTGLWGVQQERLLGTLILNQLIDAIGFLRNKTTWRGVYYVYIDEAGKYATPKVADVLDYSRHLGLRFTFAHQRFNQFEDQNVRSAIKSAKIKILLNTPHREDRDEMIRMMYGGELSDRAVSYELMDLPKQHAAIKINKNPPRRTRLPDVFTPEVPVEQLVAFKNNVYRHEWYRQPREILYEINARFERNKFSLDPEQPSGETRVEPKRPNKKLAKSPAVSDSGTDSKARPRPSKRRPIKTFLSEE